MTGTVTRSTPRCARCDAPLTAAEAGFCEVCGIRLDPATASLPTRDVAATLGLPPKCDNCGGAVDPEGYCADCGLRALELVAADDRGAIAAATHRGRRHPRNEDAAGVGRTAEGWPVLAVADGVSQSPNPHRASSVAVAAAVGALEGRPYHGPDDLTTAIAAGHHAASQVAATGDDGWEDDGTHPASTLVLAVITDLEIQVANIGDSRAYLFEPEPERGVATGRPGWRARLLTVDHAIGHGLTAWLGADAMDPEAHLATLAIPREGIVLVCSDGLWNYAPDIHDIAGVAADVMDPSVDITALPAGQIGAQWVAWAIRQGGDDNISVALAAAASTTTRNIHHNGEVTP